MMKSTPMLGGNMGRSLVGVNGGFKELRVVCGGFLAASFLATRAKRRERERPNKKKRKRAK